MRLHRATPAAERSRLRQAMKQATSARLYRRLQAVLLAGEGATASRIAAVSWGGRASIPSSARSRSPLARLEKSTLAANRQFASVDELAAAASWVRTLTPIKTLHKTGLLSRKCWLKEVRKTLCSST